MQLPVHIHTTIKENRLDCKECVKSVIQRNNKCFYRLTLFLNEKTNLIDIRGSKITVRYIQNVTVMRYRFNCVLYLCQYLFARVYHVNVCCTTKEECYCTEN